ncbi:sulfite exporter TauE/SafE family protein [Alkalicoccobacillus porphyridii]|uniref:Probable membrane transporter protein n=1 Tax=Alkalicoccobacillus porphyridii TaxID=2597270 RepID=A0A554A1S5_9BACI|nr:sulfite exporter TauE/SafE family protein [Alkalicoccobacillus porphyridii]TSB47606.1 sulfite exporter TauE/SafE family protein [Alkalicoccobacillus porphyridii]
MIIIMTMFLLGILLGFIGAGGAGFVIALLTVAFGFPIHTALGTSLAAMAFTTLSGAYSHFREKNVDIKLGTIVGLSAFFSSFAGAKLAVYIQEDLLHYFTAAMLLLSAVCMLIKLFMSTESSENKLKTRQLWSRGIVIGVLTGLLAGMFGVGSAPFIQLGLLIFLQLSLRQSVGTTMLVILPISIGGGLGYVTEGFVDGALLLKVLIGTMAGAYVGAKFTNLAPKPVLKVAVIATPAVAGLLLLI